MPRFAILEHDHPFLHWDFLLEAGDNLRAWRLLGEPRRGPPINAEPLPAHRLLYLDYEGPVSGDRGRVARWDSGTFEWELDDDGEIDVSIAGMRVIGRIEVRRATDTWTWTWK
jgi:hypothetical protein